MANPLFNKFGRNNQNASGFIPGQNNGNNMLNLMQRFQQFKNSFQGDPREQVQNLLDSGQMSQEQFEKLSQMAQMFQGMMRR